MEINISILHQSLQHLTIIYSTGTVVKTLPVFLDAYAVYISDGKIEEEKAGGKYRGKK